jgi:hypothetical protein
MRWCAGVWMAVGVAVLVACGTSAGGAPSPSWSVNPTGRSPSAAFRDVLRLRGEDGSRSR